MNDLIDPDTFRAVHAAGGWPTVLARWPHYPYVDADVPVRPNAAHLALVSACPSRGSVLPVSLQPECGCAELTECRAGKGRTPGAVTLRECLGCITSRPTSSPANPA